MATLTDPIFLATQAPVSSPGWTALLPPLVAIGMAFITRRVLLSLALGILAGGVALSLQTGDPRDLNVITRFVIPSIASRSYAMILLVYLACLGGMIGIWQRTGAVRQLAERIGSRVVRGPSSALLFAWACGVLFHQGGTVSCVLAGFTARPLADRNRVSHEELSFVVDATASPIAAILPLNAWPALYAGILIGTAPPASDLTGSVGLYLRSIPYNAYAWIMVAAALLIGLGWLPPRTRLAKAARRARDSGQLDADDARPLIAASMDRANPTSPSLPAGVPSREGSSREGSPPEGYSPEVPAPGTQAVTEWPGYRAAANDVWLPLATLVVVAALVYFVTRSFRFEAAFSLAVVSLACISRQHGLPWIEVGRALLNGWKSMLLGAVVLGLAVTLGTAAKEVGTGAFLIASVGDSIPPVALPALALVISGAIAFATGTSLGTAAVVIPALVPLAWSIQPDVSYLYLVVGAITGGAVFGDQSSPLSDTTILASMFTGADLMHHVRSQLPITLACAAVATAISAAAAMAIGG